MAFGFDVVDIITGGYMPGSYAKANPLIGIVSYCASQVDFLQSCVATLFLLLKRKSILKSAEVLEELTKQNAALQVQVKKSLKTSRFSFYLVIFLTLVGAISKYAYYIALEPGMWDSRQPYAMFHGPRWLINFYFRTMTIVCIATNYPVKALFAYFTSFLHAATREFYQTNLAFLRSLENKNHDEEIYSSELYVHRLRDLRQQSERINAAFDVIQETLNVKLLCDVTLNLVGMCVSVASLSIWSVDPGWDLASLSNMLQIVLVIGIKMFCVVVVVSPSISLFRQVRQPNVEIKFSN